MASPETIIVTAAGDGPVRNETSGGGGWSGCRSGSSGTKTAYPSSTNDWGCYSDIANPMIYRYFAPFDTSIIPDGATITAASLFIKPYFAPSTGGGGTTANNSCCVVESTQASTTGLTTSDYGSVGTTEFADRVAFSAFSSGTFKEIPLNAAGLAAINKTGFTKLALRTGYDLDNVAPTGTSGVGFYFGDHGTSGNRPYLVVTYTEGTVVSASDTMSASESASAKVLVGSSAGSVTDAMTDTDTVTLDAHVPTGNSSADWVKTYSPRPEAALTVLSNRAVNLNSFATATSAIYRFDPPGGSALADGFIEADVTRLGSLSDYVGLFLRYQQTPTFDGYHVIVSGGGYGTAGTLYLVKVVSGSETSLGSYAIPGGLVDGTTYRVGLFASGTTISVRLDNATVISVTDSSLSSGKPGLDMYSPGSHTSSSTGFAFDNVVVQYPVAAPSLADTVTVSEPSAVKTDDSTKSASDTVSVADAYSRLLVAPQVVAGAHETRAVHGSPATLFASNGTAGTHGAHYGLPDGITLPDGTMLVVARKATAHSVWDGDIVAKTKAPGGSWSAEATIMGTAYDERDPSLGLLADGTLCMTWNRLEVNGTYGVGDDDYFYAPFSTCAAGLDPLVAANWTTPVHITGTGLANNWRVGTDILELTPGGRIVVALYGTPAYPPWTEDQCWIAYTDDRGATWGMLSLLDNGNAHALSSSGEAQLALCSDGSVLAVYRTLAAPWETWARRSTDGCATWSAEWRVAQNSVNKTGMIRTPDGDHLICFGLNASTLAFSQSWDDGAAFAAPTNTGLSANLYAQPFSIGAAGVTPNVAVVYAVENGSQNIASVYYVELTRGASLATSLAETATVSDSAAVTVGVGAITKTASDGFNVTDTSGGRLITFRKSASEAILVTDSSGTSTTTEPVKYRLPVSADFVSARGHTANFVSAQSQTADFIPSPSTVT